MTRISFPEAITKLQELCKSMTERMAVKELLKSHYIEFVTPMGDIKRYKEHTIRKKLIQSKRGVYTQLPTSDKDVILEDIKERRYKAKINEMERKYNALLKEYEHAEARVDAVLNITEPLDSVVIEPLESKRDESTAIIGLSDWHFEETVEKETINNINEYTLKIAEKRFFNCVQNSLKLVKKERHTDNVNQLVLWLGGDFITGYIHEELIEGNSLSPTQATRFAKQKITAAIEFYLKYGEFERIIIPTSYGNHGRTTKKIQAATGYKNSYEWMMYMDLQDWFKNEPKVQFIVNNGIFTYVEVYGKVNRFWHGDNIRFGGGVGGLTIPLRKAIMETDRQRRADFNFLGHFHNYFEATNNCLVNGSGIGFGPYAQRINASPEPPIQMFKTLNKKHGYTSKYPIIC